MEDAIMWTRRPALALAATLAFAAPAFAADFTLNVNTALTVDDPLFKGLEAFRDNVAKSSNGKIEIKLFPGSQLGPDEDVLEQARAGAGVAVVVDGGRLGAYVKEFGILGAPYVAKDFDELRKLVTSPLFEEWVGKLRTASGHQILSFNWFQGQRHLLTNKAVTKPADLAGVRMRTPGAPVWLETVRALGATPTPMPWAEVYSALQLQGDRCRRGAASGLVRRQALRAGEVHHQDRPHQPDHRPRRLAHLVRQAAGRPAEAPARGGPQGRRHRAPRARSTRSPDYEAQFREKGVTVAEIDVTPFREVDQAVYDKLGYGDLRKQVEAASRNNTSASPAAEGCPSDAEKIVSLPPARSSGTPASRADRATVVRLLHPYRRSLAMSFFALTATLVFLGALTRTAGYPLIWAIDIAQMSFVWACVLGADIALKRNAHIEIDILVRTFSRDARRILAIVFLVMISVFLATLVWLGIKLTLLNLERPLGDVGISYGFVTSAIPAGAFLMLHDGAAPAVARPDRAGRRSRSKAGTGRSYERHAHASCSSS